jgi:formate-dependent nitrite reductase cytochrome c552 subunit
MKNSHWVLFIALFLLLVIVLGTSEVALARPPSQPPIPHTLEGRSDCIACHGTGLAGAPKFPPDHAGRTNEMCQVCHKPGPVRTTSPTATVIARPATASSPVPTTNSIPRIPHSLQGRDNCLACHATGLGGSPKVPASHAGRTNETCRICHQPASPAEGQAPIILPTPIAHAPTANKNSCVDCHSKQSGALANSVKDWQTSIHAERNVNCVDCHGGDASQDRKEDAKARGTGYIGIPKTVDIPALCASCHANVEQMRQYDLPTDQWTKYQTSIHGQKLAQGDTKVATCFVCHDRHATKRVKDPSAQVYPLNVPALCASCHSNAELMKPYNIPTNQYQLYTQSVHGIALLQRQDLRAPSCATCHGTHGAAPPGFEEVANVCGSCHTATQDYYLKSVHASNLAGTPKCVSCHGRYDVGVPSEDMFIGTGPRQCGSCHAPNSAEGNIIRSLVDEITKGANAVDTAQAAIDRAAGSALIVAPEEVKLSQARTSLITARAAQHTLNLDLVKEKTGSANTQAQQVTTDAQKATSDSILRRQVMGIGLGIMALAIASLWVIRRELYKQLPPK